MPRMRRTTWLTQSVGWWSCRAPCKVTLAFFPYYLANRKQETAVGSLRFFSLCGLLQQLM